ncbi:MAG: hypothetical protein JWO11_597, partial [Nocardioides sp.]|nr:hypothetical protein [Nocardioides sp.]
SAARAHEQLVTGETLATSYETRALGHDSGDVPATEVIVGDGERATIALTRA